jgi:hypothetical protein
MKPQAGIFVKKNRPWGVKKPLFQRKINKPPVFLHLSANLGKNKGGRGLIRLKYEITEEKEDEEQLCAFLNAVLPKRP